jgi:Fe-S-cluster containining protein
MGCPGYCCRCFILSHGPEEIDEALSKDGNELWFKVYSDYRNGVHTVLIDRKELEQLKDILIPLGRDPSKFDERNLPALKDTVNRERRILNTSQCYYSCKEYDWDTHLCKIYENRPKMCRNYPNGNACEFAGCDEGSSALINIGIPKRRSKDVQESIRRSLEQISGDAEIAVLRDG